jgi:hypothetical protein
MWSLFAATVQRATAQARHSDRELSRRLAQGRAVWQPARAGWGTGEGVNSGDAVDGMPGEFDEAVRLGALADADAVHASTALWAA